MLQLKQLKFRHQQGTQFSFDFSVRRGVCLAISGASGCGKSTLLNLIAGFLKPQQGEISFRGQAFSGLQPAERPLTILFQEHNLFNHLSVYQNVALGLDTSLKLTQAQQQAVFDSLAQLSLSGLEQRLPEDLSGGQRQRVGLARCLARSKPLLLLDEPFTGLNPALKEEIKIHIQAIRKKLDLTVLWVTHSLDDVEGVADQYAHFENGQLVFG